MKSFKVATLGCRTNQYETAAIQKQLMGLGLQETGGVADVVVVNTCTVTSGADSASRHEIRKLVRENPGARVVVTGCLAERLPQEMAQIEGVTDVVRNPDKEKLIEKLFPEAEYPEFSIETFPGHTRAFVKVQDGCNSFCTYCIIPYVRGRSRSRDFESIVREVEGLVAAGYKEIVLTGINIGDFNGSGKRLSDLVHLLAKMPGIHRLRLSSIDPDDVDEALLEAILTYDNCCPSLHLVLQAGSNAMLKRMNRKYTRQIFLRTVEACRAKWPDFTFTTDIIVGFPGETESDFQETVEVVEDVGFAKVHFFPYSPRPRTRAALYPQTTTPEVMKARKERLAEVCDTAAFRWRERFVGREVDVLVEDGTSGHTPHFVKLFLKELYPKNEIVRVLCRENGREGLLA